MGVIRQENWLGQQRVDVPHLRSVEAGVAGDFDALAGVMIAGKVASVVKGFTFASGYAGKDVSALQLLTAGGAVLHFQASESGTIFTVPDDRAPEVLSTTNPRLSGSFVPNATNFVGIDLVRTADDTTSDIVQFLDANTNTETPARVALARTLDYLVVVSTNEFSATPNVLPVAKVVTDPSNKVLSVTDARQLLFRLGRGGSSPNALSTFAWPGGRNESNVALAAVGGDRSILSLKNWLDSVMTRLWEIGGGEYWYSLTADRNVRLGGGAVFSSTGQPFEIVSGNVHWQGLVFVFDNSTGFKNEILDQLTDSPGLTNLSDGEVLYVDLDRTQNRLNLTSNPLVMQKAPLATLGTSLRPGNRYAVAWRIGSNYYVRDQFQAFGSTIGVATTSVNGIVRLAATPFAPSAPVVANATSGDFLMGMSGFSRTGTGTSGPLSIGGLPNDTSVSINSVGSSNRTSVQAYSSYSFAQQSAFKVQQYGDVFVPANMNDAYDARIQEWYFSTGNVAYVEAGGAFGHAVVPRPPYTPTPVSGDLGRVKKFYRQSLYWLTNCRCKTNGGLGAVTMSGPTATRTITTNTNTVTSLDGVTLALNDRVLVEVGGTVPLPDLGVYKVTQLANGTSLPLILQRTTDANTSAMLFERSAVQINEGTVGAGQKFWQSASNVVLGTTNLVWTAYLGPKEYRDQECTMWWDGSVTIIAESPPVAVA